MFLFPLNICKASFIFVFIYFYLYCSHIATILSTVLQPAVRTVEYVKLEAKTCFHTLVCTVKMKRGPTHGKKKPQNIPLHYLWSKGSTVKFIHLVALKKIWQLLWNFTSAAGLESVTIINSYLAVIYSFVHPLISVLLLYHLIYTITHHLCWNGDLSDMDAMENGVILGSFAA